MKSLEITEEEKDALIKYVNWEYTYINLLTNGDMKAISKLNNDSLNIFSKEYFGEQIETLKRMYSAMVKYSYGKEKEDRRTQFDRGTTLSELKSIEKAKGLCNKTLSTTTDDLTVKQHAGSKVMGREVEADDKISVIMHLYVVDSNLPYLYVNSVLQEESSYDREKEYIISPFTKFKKIQHISSWNGYEYYSAEVEGQELEKVENEEELLGDINENISKIPELVSTYSNSKGKYERASRALETERDNWEDKSYWMEKRKEAEEEMEKSQNEFDEIRGKMVQYAKGVCFHAREKVEREAKEETKQIKMQEAQEKLERQKEGLKEYSQTINGYLRTLLENTSRYQMYAKELGLTWNTEISEQSLVQVTNEIQENIAQRLNDMNQGNFKSKNEVNEGISCPIDWQLENAVKKYNDANCSKQIRIDLNTKVDELIQKSKLETIEASLRELEGKKVGIFGRIVGKDKELELQKEQLRLKKELIEAIPIKKNEDCSVNEIMARILSYQRQNNGVLPEELKVLAVQTGKVFRIDNKAVETIVRSQSTGEGLIPYSKKRNLFRRNANSILQQQNEKLKQELQEIKQSPENIYREQNCYVPRITDSVRTAYYALKNISEGFAQSNEQTIEYGEVQQ